MELGSCFTLETLLSSVSACFRFHTGAGTFIKSGEMGTWCRGTITGLIPLQREERRKPPGLVRYRVCDIALLEVFLTDWGSSVALHLPGCVYRGRVLSTVVGPDCCHV